MAGIQSQMVRNSYLGILIGAVASVLFVPTAALADTADSRIRCLSEVFWQTGPSHREAPKGRKLRYQLFGMPQTIFPVAIIEGTYPNSRRLLMQRLAREPWPSSHLLGRQAPQGDPRWMGYLLGLDAWGFFGYEMVSKQFIAGPLMDEMNFGIERFNRLTPAELNIPVHFYDAKELVDGDPRGYCERWSLRARLPFDRNSGLAIHDMSYHSGAIFLYEEAVKHSRRITQALFDFESWMNSSENWKDGDFEFFQEVMSKVYARQADLLDAGNGNVMGYLAFDPKGLKYSYRELLGGGASPHQYLHGTIELVSLLQVPIYAPLGKKAFQRRRLLKQMEHYFADAELPDDFDTPFADDLNAFRTKVAQRVVTVKSEILRIQRSEAP